MDRLELKPGWLHEGKPQTSALPPQQAIDYRQGDFLGLLLGNANDDDDDTSHRFSNGKSNSLRGNTHRGGYSSPRVSVPYRSVIASEKQMPKIAFLYLAHHVLLQRNCLDHACSTSVQTCVFICRCKSLFLRRAHSCCAYI
jgi:hypothetical protein